MGTITANISDDIEKLFRQRVYAKYGNGKGVLGKAMDEAMLAWTQRQEHFEICFQLLEQGKNLGGTTYKNREELHDRH